MLSSEVRTMKFSIKAFVTGLILSLMFISVKNIYSCELGAQSYRGLYRALKKGKLDNLYIGSSMFRKGITLYGDESDSFLICYNGLDPVTENMILECLFGRGLEVRNLYVDMYAYSAVRASWPSDMRLMFDSPLELKLEVWKNTMKNPKADFFSTSWELLARAENDMFILWPMYKTLIAPRYYRGGYSAETFNRGLTPEAMSMIKTPKPESAKMNLSQKKAIVSMIELCKKYNVKLTFIETPKYKSLAYSPEYSSVMGEYIELLRDYGTGCIVSRSTMINTNVAEGDNISSYDFPCEDSFMFEDHIHLSTNGSKKFMSALREISGRINVQDE